MILVAACAAVAASAAAPATSRAPQPIVGTNHADRLEGTAAGDRIDGRGGADRLDGRAGPDVLIGGAGFDHLNGGRGADVIRARDSHPDVLNCGPGRDVAYVDRVEDGVYGCERLVPPTSARRQGASR